MGKIKKEEKKEVINDKISKESKSKKNDIKNETEDEQKLRKAVKRRIIYEILAAIQALIITIMLLIFIVNFVNHKNCVTSSKYSDTETVAAFNSKFDSYIGNEIRGTNVKALLAMIRDNNLNANNVTVYGIAVDASNAGLDFPQRVTKIDLSDISIINGEIMKGNLNAIRNNISGGKTYKVEAEYSEKTRFINKFIITLQSTNDNE